MLVSVMVKCLLTNIDLCGHIAAIAKIDHLAFPLHNHLQTQRRETLSRVNCPIHLLPRGLDPPAEPEEFYQKQRYLKGFQIV